VDVVELPVDDAAGRTERLQLGGQGKTDGTGTDDQDVKLLLACGRAVGLVLSR